MADNQRVSVDQMADVIMDGLLEYAELATDVMKDCVILPPFSSPSPLPPKLGCGPSWPE